MLPSIVDLVTGSCCPGCDAAGHLICPGCLAELSGRAAPTRPTPCPPGLVRTWTAGRYDGLLRTLVLGHKEQHQFGLRRPLGSLLADAVAGLAAAAGPAAVGEAQLVLVPVPSRPRTVRARGHDPTLAMVRTAARILHRGGGQVRAARLLRVGPVADQADLDARERTANLQGSMSCPSRAVAGVARSLRRGTVPGRAWFVICDDVLTTGATAREAQRALESVGLGVLGVATVAATSRRTPTPGAGPGEHWSS